MPNKFRGFGATLLALTAASPAFASSHREAPFITKNPKVDATDFYMFRSYEPGRESYVTLIADFQPFQDPFAGPNYYSMDPEARYEIHVDNNGDAKEDLTFRFKFSNTLANGGKGLEVGVDGKQIGIPLINIGPISVNDASNKNVIETYSLSVVRGERRAGTAREATNRSDNTKVFTKPTDNIGTKSIPNYAAYAAAHTFDIDVPGCDTPGRVFAGARKEPFAVNLGTIFDLVNAPASVVAGGTSNETRNLAPNSLAAKNITTLALEIPISCLKGDGDVIGGWTTSSVRQVRIVNPEATYPLPSFEGGAWTQVARLSTPLVNEVIIGLKDKDRFNSSKPEDDAQFADYVTNPSLPALLEVLFGAAGAIAPTAFPRADLVQAFLTGVPSVNANGSTAEMLRLNTALPVTVAASQNNLGAAACFVNGVLTLTNPGCDPAGFPNGRRPGDDVVDIALRVAMGYLLPPASAPAGQVPFTDATLQDASQFNATFPYFLTPLPGAVTPGG